MKMFLIAFFLLNSYAYSARSHRCEGFAKSYAFKVYKGECGGYGEVEDCSIQKTKVNQQKFAATVSCGYSGEPDYSDSLEIELLIDSTNCRILHKKINECYTN